MAFFDLFPLFFPFFSLSISLTLYLAPFFPLVLSLSLSIYTKSMCVKQTVPVRVWKRGRASIFLVFSAFFFVSSTLLLSALFLLSYTFAPSCRCVHLAGSGWVTVRLNYVGRGRGERWVGKGSMGSVTEWKGREGSGGADVLVTHSFLARLNVSVCGCWPLCCT